MFMPTTGRCRFTPGWKRQLKPWSALGDLDPDRTTAVIMKQRRGRGALVGAGPASGLLSDTDRVTMSFFGMLRFFIESKRAGSWRPIAIGSGVWISRWRGDADLEQMPKRDRVISTW